MKRIVLVLLIAVCLSASAQIPSKREDLVKETTTTPMRTGESPRDYMGPVALGPFSINNKAGGVILSKLLSGLMQPSTPTNGEDVCYQDAAHHSHLVIERATDDRRLARGVTIGNIPGCPSKKIGRASGFADWATEKGLHVGSAERDVILAYGKPNAVWDAHTKQGFAPYPKDGDSARMTTRERILVYLPRQDSASTSHAFFGVRGGSVVWLTVSDSE